MQSIISELKRIVKSGFEPVTVTFPTMRSDKIALCWPICRFVRELVLMEWSYASLTSRERRTHQTDKILGQHNGLQSRVNPDENVGYPGRMPVQRVGDQVVVEDAWEIGIGRPGSVQPTKNRFRAGGFQGTGVKCASSPPRIGEG